MQRDRESGLTIVVFILALIVLAVGAILLVGSYFSSGHRIDVTALMPRFDVPVVLVANTGQPGGACLTLPAVSAQLKAQVPDATVGETNAAGYMPLFNALPPATDLPVPQRLLAAESPSLPMILLLGFGRDGCQFLRGVISKSDHRAILDKLEASI